MVKISNASYETEIHRVDSPFNEDSNNINFLAREALLSGEERPENVEKMAKNKDFSNLLLCKLGSGYENTGLYSILP